VRALVTGARGFVGRHLVAHLRAEGDQVCAVDREHDVTDVTSLRDLFTSERPDVVYHLAARTHVGDSWDHAEEYRRVNVGGTTAVLDVAHAAVPSATVVIVSSSEVYGIVTESDLPLTETSPVAPANPYATTKRDTELVALSAASRGQRVVVARPFNHVGPGQDPSFVVPALASRLLDARRRGLDHVAVGDLSTRRDFLDVRDVVRAYRLLAQQGVSGDIYNVASGVDVAIGDIAAALVSIIAPGVQLVVDRDLLRPVEVPVSRGDARKLREATGWEPRIALATSLRDVVADLTA